MTKNKKESEEKKEPMLALSKSVEMFAARDRDIRIRIRFRFIDTLDAAAKKNRPGHSAKLNNTIFMFLVIIILYSTLFCVLRCASFFVCVPCS